MKDKLNREQSLYPKKNSGLEKYYNFINTVKDGTLEKIKNPPYLSTSAKDMFNLLKDAESLLEITSLRDQ